MQQIGEELKAWRKAHNYTYRQAAEETGLSIATLSCVEKGTRPISDDMREKITNAIERNEAERFPELSDEMVREIGYRIVLRAVKDYACTIISNDGIYAYAKK